MAAFKVVVFLLLGLALAVNASTAIHKANNHAFRHHEYIRRASLNTQHEVMFVIKHRNMEKLEKELYEVSDPASGKYGMHWSRTQIDDLTRNDASTQAVRDFFALNGIMEATDKSKSGDLYLYASATLSKWEELFGAEFHEYTDANTGFNLIRSKEMTIPSIISEHVDMISSYKNLLRC